MEKNVHFLKCTKERKNENNCNLLLLLKRYISISTIESVLKRCVPWNSQLSHLHRLAKSDYRCVQSVCHTTRCSLCCLRTQDHYPKRSLRFPVEQMALFKYQETCCFPIDISTSMLRHSRVTSSSRTKIRNPSPILVRSLTKSMNQGHWDEGHLPGLACRVFHRYSVSTFFSGKD